jgi:subtilisin family serine protease
MCRFILCFLFPFLLNFAINAQVSDKALIGAADKKGDHENQEKLLELAKGFDATYQLQQQRLDEAVAQMKVPRTIMLSPDKTAVLVDFVDGVPYYVAAHNLQARKTTGVDQLQAAPGGVTLTGNKILVGVWDEGFVRNTHVEFGNRVTNKGGADFSNHATHVTGTIIAAGVNPSAKGMLPVARVDAYHGFVNDLANMAVAASEGLVVSNHSYGLLLGWEFQNGNWVWHGGTDEVDATFGHYSSQSRSLDEIAYNAQYYTIVRSAGNDRSDAGDGSRPPDGPFDCIGPAAVAKNVITVGAITGFNTYQGPQSAVMSTFSSWGPTNDGRIKPDVVGDGVGVLSTSSSGDAEYTSLQGTSMAAPNVAGSIALLQQYYRQTADTFLTSAALKALVIHTTREAGVSPGPDYSFGWGVVNVQDGYSVLKNRDNVDTVLVEGQLANDGVNEYSFFSDGRSAAVSTIAWTDVSGTPPAEASPTSMLVNDLDIRLTDPDGNEIRPWTLNPASPTAGAVKADNICDNVEKIEAVATKPGLYTLRVSHKGTLVNAPQNYGLVFTGSSIQAAGAEIYWVDGQGNVTDTHWALTSGGTAPGGIQPNDKSWVFDNNSQIVDNDVIFLEEAQTIRNLIWTSAADGIIDLNGDTLFIEREIFITNTNLKIRNGVLVLNGINAQSISLTFDGSENCTVVFDNDSPITLLGDVNLSSMVVTGSINLEGLNVQTGELSLVGGGDLTANNNEFFVNAGFSVENGVIAASGNHWVFTNADITTDADLELGDDTAEFFGSTALTGRIILQKAQLNDVFTSTEGFEVDTLDVAAGSALTLIENATITIHAALDIDGAETDRTSIAGSSNTDPAIIDIRFRKLLCMDFLDLTSITFQTESVINTGLNSMMNNVSGAVGGLCDDMIFPDFHLPSTCASSSITIINNSVGEIEDYLWDFGDGQFIEGVNNVPEPTLVFDTPGEYTFKLTVSKGDLTVDFEREVAIVENNISVISIVQVEQDLVASILVPQYVWYFNSVPIQDQTSRILTPPSSGSYRVSYTGNSSTCENRISNAFEFELVTAVTDPELPEGELKLNVYPNPVDNTISVSQLLPGDRLIITDLNGKELLKKTFDDEWSEAKLFVGQLSPGMLLLRIHRNSKISIYKIIKK